MERKLFFGAMLIFSVSMLFFSSCNKDDDKPLAPTVKITELGSGHDSPNDKIGYIGSEFHLEATITADGLIKEILVEVHQENGNGESKRGYSFNEKFTDSKYVGLKNTTFHEHIDIPADAPEGEYHLHLMVVDQYGQSTTAESDLTIKAGHGDDDDDDDHDHDHGH